MNRKHLLSILGVALGIGSLAAVASAETVVTTDGNFNVIENVAPLGTALTYVSGGNGLIGVATSWPTMGDTPGNRAIAMNSYDHTWLQYPDSILMHSNVRLNEVFAIPGVDHDFDQYESLEFRIWGSNVGGSLLEEGTIGAIYRDGFDTANTTVGHSDDYTSLWRFSNHYNYFMITGGSHHGTGDFNVNSEGEIDGLAARSAVPEPSSVLLLASGIAGLALRRRKQAK